MLKLPEALDLITVNDSSVWVREDILFREVSKILLDAGGDGIQRIFFDWQLTDLGYRNFRDAENRSCWLGIGLLDSCRSDPTPDTSVTNDYPIVMSFLDYEIEQFLLSLDGA